MYLVSYNVLAKHKHKYASGDLFHLIGTYRNMTEKYVPYKEFINKELVLFSRADLERSIPALMDGLKPG